MLTVSRILCFIRLFQSDAEFAIQKTNEELPEIASIAE